MNHEFERLLNDPEIHLQGRIYGQGPVQAEGTIKGKKFYFRARHDQWTFALTEDEEIDPVDISFLGQGFYRAAPYGKPRGYAASYMPYDEAENFIKACAREYRRYSEYHT